MVYLFGSLSHEFLGRIFPYSWDSDYPAYVRVPHVRGTVAYHVYQVLFQVFDRKAEYREGV